MVHAHAHTSGPKTLGSPFPLIGSVVAVWLLALILMSCRSLGDPTAACAEQSDAFGAGSSSVEGAFTTDISHVRELIGDLPDALANRQPESQVILCYVDGEYDRSGPPGGNQATYDRGLFAIVGDETVLIKLGYQASMPIEAP